jgi:DNA polymerase
LAPEPRAQTWHRSGEQPGDVDDRRGKPFVGPAGGVLDRALAQAGIDRQRTYVTNAVKHFKWEARGKRRIHNTPNRYEIGACRPWLQAELLLVRPKVIVAMGATAARGVLEADIPILKQRGKVLQNGEGPPVAITLHPSSVLRSRDDERRLAMMESVEDLRAAPAAAR